LFRRVEGAGLGIRDKLLKEYPIAIITAIREKWQIWYGK
jgi:hypothetical protein